jgi:hypothetical protein
MGVMKLIPRMDREAESVRLRRYLRPRQRPMLRRLRLHLAKLLVLLAAVLMLAAEYLSV